MQTQFCFQPRAANQNPPLSQVAGAGTGSVAQITVPLVQTECTMRIVIDGPSSGAWCYGTQAGLTASNGVFMVGNTVETFSLPAGISTLSFIFASGTNFRVIFGDGA